MSSALNSLIQTKSTFADHFGVEFEGQISASPTLRRFQEGFRHRGQEHLCETDSYYQRDI